MYKHTQQNLLYTKDTVKHVSLLTAPGYNGRLKTVPATSISRKEKQESYLAIDKMA